MDGGTIVRINKALLDPALGAVRSDDDDDQLVVLRASVQLGSDGFFELIPERGDDKNGAIVFVDIGAGAHSIVRYTTNGFERIATGGAEFFPFSGYQETLLAALAPFSCVKVNRYQKRWIFFGKEELKEVLTYRFDGRKLVLTNLSPSRFRD
jgi:hypothetical protein